MVDQKTPENKAQPEEKKDEKPKKTKEELKKEEEMTEEDLKLKADLELMVERVSDAKPEIQKAALDNLTKEIRESTSSMTSIPKPLKFLRPHFKTCKDVYDGLAAGSPNKAQFADVLSVMAMTMGKKDERESLNFRLQGGATTLKEWGHEYIRTLCGEIPAEFTVREKDGKGVDDLLKLVDDIVPIHIGHNAEPEACDLLMEVDKLQHILTHVDDTNYVKVALYLEATSKYVPEPDDRNILKVVVDIFRKVKKTPSALQTALMLNDQELSKEIFEAETDPVLKKQLAFLMARQRVNLEVDDEEINEILCNTKLSEHFIKLGKDLEVSEAKKPEDIYKTHLQTGRVSSNLDSAKANLASSFVNAFVNAGFCEDTLMLQEGAGWLHKNKDHGMMSTSASVGMLMLWEVEEGLTQIDRYLYSEDPNTKAGVLLGAGIVTASVRNEIDPVLALLQEYTENKSEQNGNLIVVGGAVSGLGLAYTGTEREEVMHSMTSIIGDENMTVDLVGLASLSLGLTYVGSCNEDAAQAILMALLDRGENLTETYSRFMCLGLGLLFLGTGESADATLEALKVMTGPQAQVASLVVETCAYAGTGNVLKIQKMLHICSEHLEKDNEHQAVAVLGIALISMAEDIGSEMAFRTMDHILQYADINTRRAVPLAIGLLSMSNPRVSAIETLSKLSHDTDPQLAQSAIFAMGLIGAGTNNARLASALRQLAQYYYKDQNHMFVVRIAQGLLHMGKGLISLNLYHTNRSILSNNALAGVLSTLYACLDMKNVILSKGHYFIYYLVLAMFPRMLITVDEDLNPLPVTVRVGQAVDVVAQAGKPKSITGFQTHTTPVLIGAGERAELGTDEYLAMTATLEGFVILKKNPDYVAPEEEEEKKN
eukprot:GFYU01000568.1.p1 GENE.GFYU01000568.1~~GFYU01000568.1.p1  ORF type:complete len:882 (-),score=333.91 GFYU01000568.1:196-2841(-)